MTRVLLTLGALLLLLAAPARAADFDVTKPADTEDGACSIADCSLREAINAANVTVATPDNVNVPAGTYDLTRGQLPAVTSTLSILGAGAASTIIAQRGSARVLSASVALTVRDITVTGGNEPGNGGGILKTGAGALTIENSSISGNRAAAPSNQDSGGGGIHISGTGALFLTASTVSGNSSGPASQDGSNQGGGGIHHQSSGPLNIINSTIDGNTATVGGGSTSNGGGGVWVSSATLPFLGNATATSNRVNVTGVAIARGGGILNAAAGAVSFTHTLLAGNVATIGTNCSGVFTSTGNNLESHDTCSLTGSGDQPNTDPKLRSLADNGGGTPTRGLSPDSPAINGGDDSSGNCEPDDQRGVARPVGTDCDIGAFEFDGLTVASIPNCSPTGQIPLTMTSAPGEDVENFHYRIDGGAEQVVGTPGGSQASTTIGIPEGRRQLEYWGEFTNGGELGHHLPPVLVDKTRPTVDVQGGQRSQTYVIRRRATINVQAADALSGLVGDPSGGGQAISTLRRGRQTVARTATDLCGNQAADSFAYRVLGPGLGVRAVIEELSGSVRVRSSGSARSAGVAQKGRPFSALRQPREIPIGTFIDTSRGRARITSSTTSGTRIQDGQFSTGLFQVLQSRRRSARGLTELRLKGSSFRRCRNSGRGKGSARSAASRTLRRLRANARGRFRTRGRHSAATVRGTVWVTADRCDGTLTKVTRGRVAVRDFRRKKTVLVRAGKSYLARAPR